MLESILTEPTPGVAEALHQLNGDFIVLGVAGKMGPSLASMIVRACKLAGVARRVIGVSRFSNNEHFASLQALGVETIRCDLLDEKQVADLPDAANVLYLAGMKFGSQGNESHIWAMNTWLPAIICRKYRNSRIVALSTGNVYGLVPISQAGSRESDRPRPVGEYAMSCLGRERVFEYFSRTHEIPMALIRLNYACDLRYGVLVDLAQAIWHERPVDLAMGYFNTIWQGDANAMILQCFRHTASPPLVLNVSGSETLSVREVCQELGRIMNRSPILVGTESCDALLSDADRAFELFGKPRIAANQLIAWAADWVMRGKSLLNKPTGFQSRDGTF